MSRLPWLLPLALAACGGAPALFESFGPPAAALDPQTDVTVSAGVGDVAQPAVVLGVLRLPAGPAGAVSETQAKERLRVEARKHGCDAVAGLSEVRVPGRADQKQWTADCVRSGKVAKALQSAPAKPKSEPVVAKPASMSAPVAVNTPGKSRTEIDKARAEAELARAAAANSPEQADVLCRQALRCGKKCDCSVQGLLDASTGKVDPADAQAIWTALQAAVRTAPVKQWLTSEAPIVSTEEEERGPADMATADLDAELKRQGATAWKPLTPKEYTYKVTVHNPTRHPVLVDLQLADGQVSKFLQPDKSATLSHTARCEPFGAVTTTRLGNLLEMHFECRAEPVAKLLAVRAVKRELQVDKHAGDAAPTLEVISHVWEKLPNTRLVDSYLRLIDEELARRNRDTAGIRGRLQVFARSGNGAVPASVELKNGSSRRTTVVFDVGPVRDRAVVLGPGGETEVKLELPANATSPVLQVKGTLPPMQEDDWLVGRWTFREVTIAVLPSGGGLAAFLPLMPADAPPRILSSIVEVNGNEANFSFEVPDEVARTVLGKAKGGRIEFSVPLDKQTQFMWGGGRAMPLEVEGNGVKQSLTFSAEQ